MNTTNCEKDSFKFWASDIFWHPLLLSKHYSCVVSQQTIIVVANEEPLPHASSLPKQWLPKLLPLPININNQYYYNYSAMTQIDAYCPHFRIRDVSAVSFSGILTFNIVFLYYLLRNIFFFLLSIAMYGPSFVPFPVIALLIIIYCLMSSAYCTVY